MANESDTEDSEQYRIRQAEKSNQAGTRDEIVSEPTSPKHKTLGSILKLVLILGCLSVAGSLVGFVGLAGIVAIISGGEADLVAPLIGLITVCIAVSLGLGWSKFTSHYKIIIVGSVTLLSIPTILHLSDSGIWPILNKNGPYVENYESGQKKSEMFFRNGFESGIWTTWYEGGARKSAEDWRCARMEEPRPIGIQHPYRRFSEWYENGQMKTDGYLRDVFTVPVRGTMKKRDSYKLESKYGRWMAWDESGQVLSKQWLIDGRPVSYDAFKEYTRFNGSRCARNNAPAAPPRAWEAPT